MLFGSKRFQCVIIVFGLLLCFKDVQVTRVDILLLDKVNNFIISKLCMLPKLCHFRRDDLLCEVDPRKMKRLTTEFHPGYGHNLIKLVCRHYFQSVFHSFVKGESARSLTIAGNGHSENAKKFYNSRQRRNAMWKNGGHVFPTKLNRDEIKAITQFEHKKTVDLFPPSASEFSPKFNSENKTIFNSNPNLEPVVEPTPDPLLESETEPSSTSVSEPVADTEPNSEPDNDDISSSIQKSKPTTEPDSNSEREQDVISNSEPDSEPSAESSSEPDSEPNAESSSEPDSEPNAESSSEPDSEPNAESSSEPDSEPNAESSSEPDSEPNAESSSEPDSEPNAESSSKPDSEPSAESSSEPDSEPSAESSSEPDSEPSAESSSETDSEPNAESSSEPDSEPNVDPSSEPESEFSEAATFGLKVQFGTESTSEPISEPENEPEPVSEQPEPWAEIWPEPGPDWKEALSEWGPAWTFHITVFPICFLLLAFCCVLLLVSSVAEKGWRQCNKSVIALSFLVFTFSASRAVFLLTDPYSYNRSAPLLLQRLMFSIGYPGLSASFTTLLFVILDTTKAYTGPPRFLRPSFILVMYLIHLSVVVVTDVIVLEIRGWTEIFLFVCHLLFIFYGLMCGVGFLYASYVLRRNLKASKDHHDANQPRLKSIWRLSYLSGLVAVTVGVVNIYISVGDMGTFSNVTFVEPWQWWIIQTVTRFLEVLSCIMVLTAFMNTAKANALRGCWRKGYSRVDGAVRKHCCYGCCASPTVSTLSRADSGQSDMWATRVNSSYNVDNGYGQAVLLHDAYSTTGSL